MKSPYGIFKRSSVDLLRRWLIAGIIIGVISLATGESKASFTLPIWSDTMGWDDPSCYSTIQMADLDGDGQTELLGRCTSGIVAYKFSKKLGVWSPLPPGPGWSDAGGWDQAKYYLTIQTGDLDGDGKAELLARSAGRIEAYSYSGGTWHELPYGPNWSDAEGWDEARYYLTIQTGDLDGDGQAELLARGAGGIVAYSYSAPKGQATQRTWSELPSGPAWSNASDWDKPYYYLTIQTGDLTGDGKAELLARGAEGIVSYSYSAPKGQPTQGTWSELPLGPSWSDKGGWDHPQYYRTMQMGQEFKDGRAVLIGRSSIGIDTYEYTAGKWASTSAPFPQFTGDELTAYNAINAGLDLEKGVTIRSLYGQKSAAELTTYKANITGFKRPSKVPQKAWSTVTTQIEQELTWATFVASAFNNNSQLLTDVFLSQDLTLSYVAGLLEIEEDSSDEVTAAFSDMFSGVIDAIGIGTDKVAAEVIAKLFASAIDAGTEIGMESGTLKEKYNQLVGKIDSNFLIAVNGNGNNREAITMDYGLLATVGQLLYSGTWTYPSSGQSSYQQASAAARKKYAVFLWETLTPAVWYTFPIEPPAGPYSYPNPQGTCSSGLTDNSATPTWIDKSILETLFNNNNTQPSCQTTFTTSCNLGLPLGEVYTDWGFPPVNCGRDCDC